MVSSSEAAERRAVSVTSASSSTVERLGRSWGGMRASGSRPEVGRGHLRCGVKSGAESWAPSMKPWARPRH